MIDREFNTLNFTKIYIKMIYNFVQKNCRKGLQFLLNYFSFFLSFKVTEKRMILVSKFPNPRYFNSTVKDLEMLNLCYMFNTKDDDENVINHPNKLTKLNKQNIQRGKKNSVSYDKNRK